MTDQLFFLVKQWSNKFLSLFKIVLLFSYYLEQIKLDYVSHCYVFCYNLLRLIPWVKLLGTRMNEWVCFFSSFENMTCNVVSAKSFNNQWKISTHNFIFNLLLYLLFSLGIWINQWIVDFLDKMIAIKRIAVWDESYDKSNQIKFKSVSAGLCRGSLVFVQSGINIVQFKWQE